MRCTAAQPPASTPRASLEPPHDRLAQAVWEKIIEVQVELRDHTQMGTAHLVAWYQCFDAHAISLPRVIQPNTDQVLRAVLTGPGCRRRPCDLDHGGQPVDELRPAIILHLVL